MKVKPMIFNPDMALALHEDRKGQTRRPVDIPDGWELKSADLCKITGKHPKSGKWGVLIRRETFDEIYEHDLIAAPAMPGDLIYVRETFRLFDFYDECDHADFPCPCPGNGAPIYFASCRDSESNWKPSIHMPRWASRTTLKVIGVRVERIQDISKDDAIAEGFQLPPVDGQGFTIGARTNFRHAWQQIYGDHWDSNGWCWVIDFEVIHQNVDDYLKTQEAA